MKQMIKARPLHAPPWRYPPQRRFVRYEIDVNSRVVIDVNRNQKCKKCDETMIKRVVRARAEKRFVVIDVEITNRAIRRPERRNRMNIRVQEQSRMWSTICGVEEVNSDGWEQWFVSWKRLSALDSDRGIAFARRQFWFPSTAQCSGDCLWMARKQRQTVVDLVASEEGWLVSAWFMHDAKCNIGTKKKT